MGGSLKKKKKNIFVIKDALREEMNVLNKYRSEYFLCECGQMLKRMSGYHFSSAFHIRQMFFKKHHKLFRKFNHHT